jgi:hypothetical protein
MLQYINSKFSYMLQNSEVVSVYEYLIEDRQYKVLRVILKN